MEGGVTFATATAIGGAFALLPYLWLDHFTADPQAYAFGVRYLLTVAPFYGLFTAGQTLYFASQGTGRMGLPVAVGVMRFSMVAAIGVVATLNGLDVGWLYSAVALGLVIIGAGISACIGFSTGWNPDKTKHAQPQTNAGTL